MNLTTEVFGDVVVVHTPEELSSSQADELEAFLTTLEQLQVIIDLDGTESVSSEGLAALLNARDQLREHQGDLKITTTNKVNRKILDITRIDQQLEVFESVIDAVKGFA